MFTLIGDFVDTVDRHTLRFHRNHVIVIDDGKIVEFGEKVIPKGPVTHIPEQSFVIPGFIDIHCHAPQFPNSGLGTDLCLLEWLDKHTFKTEAMFSDADFAATVYDRVVRHTLMNGTTTAVYFSTIHKQATIVLGRMAEKHGQRALIGKVCMDCRCPEWYKDDNVEAAVDDNADIITAFERSELVKPIITPRFAPVCSSDMMSRLGRMADEHGLLIQSHVSESVDEVRWMQELYPGQSYCQVYLEHGLMPINRTLLAHAIHLTEPEICLIRERNVAVAHCPISNYSLNSGILNVQRLLSEGVRVGLGSDVSGGWTSSMLQVMRTAFIASRSISRPLAVSECFWLATKGGAQCINRDDLGCFSVGCSFDALLINAHDDKLFSMPGDSLHDRFHRFFFNGDDRNILAKYVNGQPIKE